MKHVVFGLAALLLLARGARAAEPHLTAELVGGERDDRGRLVLTLPFGEKPGLSCRLTNRGDAPVQVVLSDYPAYHFVKLEVRRPGQKRSSGTLPAWFDLYPAKDRKPPGRRYVTLAPGQSVSRSFDVLLREGYGLEMLSRGPDRSGFRDLLRRGYGAIRRPGEYVMMGLWSPDATGLDGRRDVLFSGSAGRDGKIPLATGPVRTEPLTVVVRYRFPFDDTARRLAGATRVVRGKVSLEGTKDGYSQYLVEVEKTLKGPPDPTLRFRAFQRPDLAGDRLLYLVLAEGWLYPVDENSAPPATDELVGSRAALAEFQAWLAREPLVPDAKRDGKVGDLVDQLTKDAASQRAALLALENLGESAVPAIATRLDDDRALADGHVTFANRAEGAFEAVRQYRLKTVGEALLALLNQITGEQFPASGWRIYAHYRPR